MWKKADALVVTEQDRRTIEVWVRSKKTPQGLVLRAKICLLASEGISHSSIAKSLNTSRPTVILWTNRFQKKRLSGLSEDARHILHTRRLDAEKIKSIVEATLHTKPKDSTRWSQRTMAISQSVSRSTVQRIWSAYRLQRYQLENFKKFSNCKAVGENTTLGEQH